MGSIIFVHGTGVRQDSYEKTFTKISEKVKAYPAIANFNLERCIWGDRYGSRLLNQGKSIPGNQGAQSSLPDDEVLKWWLLYQNPYYDLETLRDQGDTELPPRKRNDWEEKTTLIGQTYPSTEFNRLLEDNHLGPSWQKAFGKVTDGKLWKEILPPRDLPNDQFYPDFCRCTAEAIMAEACLIALDTGEPVPTADIRNHIVDNYLMELNAKVRGPREWFDALGEGFKKVALTMYAAGDYAASQLVTTPVARNFVTDMSLTAIGDILLYQARGDKIRDYIEKKIHEAASPVFLLAHSLGGIACVDLLIEKENLCSKISGLITAGSQAPLFYEMDCLVSCTRLQSDSGSPLGEKFPPWLNFHDPNDYLSYAAREVFKSENIMDVEVKSRQPRLMAHSAYWSEPALWKEIAMFVTTHQNIED